MPRPRPEGPQLKQRRGGWEIVWWDGAERRRYATGAANEVGARQALADFEAKLARHPLKLTFAAALDRYLADRRGKVQALDRAREAADALRAVLGPLRVDQINQLQWDRYAAGRVTRPGRRQAGHVPRPVAAGTLRREFNVLRAAMHLAHHDGFLPKVPRIQPPADSAPRDRYLTKDEARRLLEAAETEHVRMFVALALFTGARKGSILALTWDRVNFATGMIDFQEPGRPLTSKRRAVVPMTAQLRLELEKVWTLKGEGTTHVVALHGRAVPTGLYHSFRKLCQRAGLDWRPTPHHMKHSVASWFAMDKVPIDQAADWLATDPATLRKVYRKFDPTYLRSVAGALDL